MNNKNDLEFQIFDWNWYHEQQDSEYEPKEFDTDDSSKKSQYNSQSNMMKGDEDYVIRLFGTTRDGKKVFVKINEFTPYFFVEIPETWKKSEQDGFVETIKDLVESNKYSSKFAGTLKTYDIVRKHKFIGFTDYKLYTFIRLVFINYEGFRTFERLFYKPIKFNRKYQKYEVFETNIEPMLRFMHICKIQSCGFIKIPANKYKVLNRNVPSHNDINVVTKWENILPVNDSVILPIMIAAFDIECTSGDGTFPQAHRKEDQVITIGTTFNMYGNSECFYKHVITLGTCAPINGVDVESYDEEKDVFIAWKNLITRMNPDIITGYNIFGFDFKYLEARSKILKCDKEFSKLSRIRDEPCKFIFKDLSSAAYGKNHFYFYDTIGRVQIDLYKVIQREHKLGSYKLDNVAAHFMREKIEKLDLDSKNNITNITTSSTYGLDKGRFVKITYNDGLSDNSYKDDKKYKIIDLKNGMIKVEELIDDLDVTKYKSYWCHAKDDVKPHELFELQKGSAQDRAKIAEYCIQDCILCNQLLEKLKILTSNIGMANVCSVPLSYIFLRGQGIKILSLVSKKCRERDHLLPVLRKNKNMDIDEDQDGYEGATVLFPHIGYHQYQVTTWDYSSLYPSSMIHRNISHECLIKDDQYLDLEDYTYYTIIYYDKEGKEVICKYAKSHDPKKVGILPEILQDLLRERSKTRKLGESEPDKFKAQIYECLQIAYKVTANSLYGQTGAKTSAIYLKEVAASTTATGREMLNCARLFSEYIYPKIIRTITSNNYDEYVKQMELLFTKQVDKLLGNKIIGFLKKYKYKATIDPKDNSHLTRASDYFYLRIFQESFGDFNENRLMDPKNNISTKKQFLKWYFNQISDVVGTMTVNPKCVYGDTDSVFVNFGLSEKENGEFITDERAVKFGIDLGILGARLINLLLPAPQNLAYEKTFWPYILLSKKRYVGNLYETNPNKYYQKSMGIVLKRRDNAPIVKIVVGGIVDKLLNARSPKEAIEYAKTVLKNILCGKYPMEKFVISKTLKGSGMTEEESNQENKVCGDSKIISNLINNIEVLIKTINADNVNDKIKMIRNLVNIIGGINSIEDDMMYELSSKILFHFKNIGIKLSDKDKSDYKRIIKDKPTSEYIVKVTNMLFTVMELNKIVNMDDLVRSILILYNKQQKLYHIKNNTRTAFKEITRFDKKDIYDEIDSKLAECLNEPITNVVPILIMFCEQIKKNNSVSKPYVDRTRIVHAVLADRMSLRDPGNKPQSNDRIPYVYVVTNHEVEIQGERVEHPDFVIENNLKLDYLFYITNQIMKPSIQILETMVKNPENIFNGYINRELNRRSGKRPINYYFDNNSKSDLVDDSFDCLKDGMVEKKPITKTTIKSINKTMTKSTIKPTTKPITKPITRTATRTTKKPIKKSTNKLENIKKSENGFIVD